MREQDRARPATGSGGDGMGEMTGAAIRNARAVTLDRSMPARQAAVPVLRECATQILANAAAVLAMDDPEGPHQLRIGLRRLRSALSLFADVLDRETANVFANEAQWLGREVGKLRDADVILAGMVLPMARSRPGDDGLAALAETLEVRSRALRTALRRTLSARRARAFLEDLHEWTEAAPWMDTAGGNQAGKRIVPLRDLAGAVLEKRWTKARARARKIDRLTLDERHELRKELKKLRYAVEFMGPLHGRGKVAPFLSHLKSLQDVFGALNDAGMAEAWFAQDPAGADARPAVQRAIGRLLGATALQAEIAWQDARRSWKDLKRTPVFWKKPGR